MLRYGVRPVTLALPVPFATPVRGRDRSRHQMGRLHSLGSGEDDLPL
jgi:hypothetical protein